MKPKTLFLIETGVAVAAISTILAVTSMRAAEGEAKAAAAPTAAASANPPPAAPGGEPADTPPVVPALVPPPLAVSPGMDEIFQLARSGVTEEVLVAFIEKSGKAYNPSADEIIYLKDLGVAPAAIAKIIRTGNRDSELANQVEAGQFAGLKPAQAAAGNSAEDSEPTPPESTRIYAAAPQPLESSQSTVDVSAEPATNVDLNYFKTSLSPYGNWVYIEGYGECWRPTVSMVSSDWRPYYDGGRWVYTNSGWYWLSDYSWGWAPFHYGRWANHGHWGWVWVPGYTWGPAWVEWRTTSAYCGWAPLPPYYGSGFGVSYWGGGWGFSIGWSYYNWVPYRYCNGYYPRHYAVHHGHGHDHYRNSTVVRPTININGNNNTVIVTGPDATVVANASRREIRRVDIRDVGGSETRGPREYLENGGKTLAAYRPTVRPDRNRPEVALANQRAEFRRPATIAPTTASASGIAVTEAEAANPRNIILRGEPNAARSAGSASAWRAATATRPVESTVSPRVAGQNTTINPQPEYRRPATEPTTIGRSALVTRPATLGNTAVGGAARSESSRPTSTWSQNSTRSLNSVPRQTVAAPSRTFQSPTTANAPTITPSRRPATDDNRATSTPNNFRSETSRNNGRPVIAPSVAPSRSETPAMRTPAMSPPTIAPSARPSYSPPPSSPSISRPPSAPAPSRSAPPASSVAPSRSSSSPPSSNSGGGGGSRSGGPRRQN